MGRDLAGVYAHGPRRFAGSVHLVVCRHLELRRIVADRVGARHISPFTTNIMHLLLRPLIPNCQSSAYAWPAIIANRISSRMGSSFAEGYPDLWADFKPIFDECSSTGMGSNYSPESSLLVERKGWREE